MKFMKYIMHLCYVEIINGTEKKQKTLGVLFKFNTLLVLNKKNDIQSLNN